MGTGLSTCSSDIECKNLSCKTWSKSCVLRVCMTFMQVPQVEGITVMHDDNTVAEEQPSDSAFGTSSSDSDPESPKASTSKSAAKQRKPISSSLAAPEQQHNQQGSLGADVELQEFQNVQERREELKQQMAVTASKLLQNPEANLPTMRSLLTLAADKDVQVSGVQFPSWV